MRRVSQQIHSATASLVATALLAIAALMLLPGLASAVPVTIEFNSFTGNYDLNAPADPELGPSVWLENNTRTEGFWLTNAGTPNGQSVLPHLHLQGENDSVFPLVGEQSHAWANDLQGISITLEDPSLIFDVVSIDYRIETRDTPPGFETVIERLPWSYGTLDTRLLLSSGPLQAATPDFATFEAQFAALQVDDGTLFDNGDGTFDPNRPADFVFRTAVVSGFDGIQTLNISHTGGLFWIDNIVLDVRDPGTPIPEPGTGLLMGLGLSGLALASRRAARIAA